VRERILEIRALAENAQHAHKRWNSLKPSLIIPAHPEKSDRGSVLPLLGAYANSLPGVKGAIEGGCDAIFFEPPFTPRMDRCGKTFGSPFPEAEISAALDNCRQAGVKLILKLPRITKDAWLDEFLSALADGQLAVKGYMVEQCGTAQAIKHAHPDAVLYGSSGLNVFNYAAVLNLASWFDTLTLSTELSGDEIRQIINAARDSGCPALFSVIVQGPVEAMVSENCILRQWLPCPHLQDEPEHSPFYGIRDATGHIFPVRIDSECRSHIYNSAELCLIDYLPSLMQGGVNEIIIDARHRTRAYARDMCRLYRQALVKAGTPREIYPSKSLKDAIKRLSMGGITAGPCTHGLKES
jgi:putative protease